MRNEDRNNNSLVANKNIAAANNSNLIANNSSSVTNRNRPITNSNMLDTKNTTLELVEREGVDSWEGVVTSNPLQLLSKLLQIHSQPSDDEQVRDFLLDHTKEGFSPDFPVTPSTTVTSMVASMSTSSMVTLEGCNSQTGHDDDEDDRDEGSVRAVDHDDDGEAGDSENHWLLGDDNDDDDDECQVVPRMMRRRKRTPPRPLSLCPASELGRQHTNNLAFVSVKFISLFWASL